MDQSNAVWKIRTQTESTWGTSRRRQPLSQDWHGRKVRSRESQRILSRRGGQWTDPERQEGRPAWPGGQGGSGEGRSEGRRARWEAELHAEEWCGSSALAETGLHGGWRQEAQRRPLGVAGGGVAGSREGAAGWMDSAWGLSPGLSPSVHPLGEAPELPAGAVGNENNSTQLCDIMRVKGASGAWPRVNTCFNHSVVSNSWSAGDCSPPGSSIHGFLLQGE